MAAARGAARLIGAVSPERHDKHGTLAWCFWWGGRRVLGAATAVRPQASYLPTVFETLRTAF